jgi:hypothetical protein
MGLMLQMYLGGKITIKKGIQGHWQAGKHWIRLIDYFHALSLQHASISVIYFPVPAGCPNHQLGKP